MFIRPTLQSFVLHTALPRGLGSLNQRNPLAASLVLGHLYTFHMLRPTFSSVLCVRAALYQPIWQRYVIY